MKRILISLIMAAAFASAHAISLFPFFGDVAGDFEDGTCQKFIDLNIPTKFWRSSPFFFKDLKGAEDFLNDVLPFSTEGIGKESKSLPDGTQIVIYYVSLEADGLYKDKWSCLYLVQTPGEPLYVGLGEDEIN